MPKACSAINCPNRDTRQNRAKGLSFHSFPKDHELRKKWMLAVNRVEPGTKKLWIPGSGACLCSQHFSQEEFEIYGGQKRLKIGVIPSVFSFKQPARGLHPSTSLKAAGIGSPPAAGSETAAPADLSPARVKTVELIQTEHRYSLSEPLDVQTDSVFPPGPGQGSEQEQRRLSYYQQELWAVLTRLREQHLLQEDAERMLKAQFRESESVLKQMPQVPLLARQSPVHRFFSTDLQLSLQCEEPLSDNYPAASRNFAASLHLFSAKAYEFMRRTFRLPEPAILRTWLSNLDYKPGFSQQAFNVLAERSQAGKQAFKWCALLLGTMPLERRIHYDPSARSLQGLVNFGTGNYDADEIPPAAEALLFVAVGFQGQWIIPLGYFLLATLKGDIQAQLLRHCILKLYDIDVQVISVTADATAPNIDTARQLGVKVDGLTVRSTFLHPATPTLEIAYYFDPSHLVSLIHNLLQVDGSLQVSGKAVSWDYLLHLGALREKEVLQAAGQAGGSRQQQQVWGNGITQLFSQGTVQALHFAARLGLPQFRGHEATALFIELLSAVFDACSSRNAHGKDSRAPLSLTNADILNNLCNEYENLLRKLRTTSGKLLWLSRHRWGFLGFLLNLRSLQWMIQTHLQAEDRPVAYLLPGWWSLDPLEWCKGAIRQACGHKEITTPGNFQKAYRLILNRAVSGLGLDPPNLLDISLCRRSNLQLQASWPLGQGQIWQLRWGSKLLQNMDSVVLTPAFRAELEDTTTPIACAVLRKLLPVLPCAECRAALLNPCKEMPVGSALMCVKSKGRDCLPSKSVQRVIRRAKQVVGLSSWFFQGSGPSDFLAQELAILADVSEEPDLFSSLDTHLFEGNSLVSNHYVILLQQLVQTFLELWFQVVRGAQPMPLTHERSSVKEMNNKQSTEAANCSSRSWPQELFGLMKWYKAL
ncbi:DNA transposase THAP9 [Candoia aspera]|uniref:DNA transposase THAP9 n=1 Tax=Candoia aspera TaxID=51853 RepID=UPI002FD83AB2